MTMTQYIGPFPGAPTGLKDRVTSIGKSFLELVAGVIDLLCALQGTYEMREHMRCLDDHILDDIGRTRGELVDEANKPFWQG